MKQNSGILNYEKSGNGPVVVFLHGYLCSLRYWDTIKTQLAKDHTVVTIDLLGFGDSPKPRQGTYDYFDHIGWIKRTLDSLHLEGESIQLAGHSMGALLALRYATVYPEAIQKLLLLNIPLFKDQHEARHELANTNLFFRLSLYWEMHRLITPIMRSALMKTLMRQAVPLMYKGMETYIFASSAEARSRSLRNVIEAQSSIKELQALRVPATILMGSKERATYLENVGRLVPSRLLRVLLTDAGHHTPLEKPDLILSLAQS